MTLAWPWLLLGLPLPLLVYWFYKPVKRQEAALKVPFYRQLTSLATANGETMPTDSKKTVTLILLSLAWFCLVLAACKPQWLGDPIQLPSNGRDLMLAVDISGSMAETDLSLAGQPANRLMVVKEVLNSFIEKRKGDRVGLILFGSQAYLQAPLTFDRHTVATLLEESQIGFAGENTALGDAIGLAVKRLRQRPENSRLLVLLTDGANTAGEIAPLKAAELAQQQHIKIHTIGVGATEMLRPGFFGTQRVNPSADLDEETLSQIAKQTDGQYFRATDTTQLEQIYALLDQLEPITQEEENYRPTHSLYYWPLAAALMLVLVLFTRQLDWRSLTLSVKSQPDRSQHSHE